MPITKARSIACSLYWWFWITRLTLAARSRTRSTAVPRCRWFNSLSPAATLTHAKLPSGWALASVNVDHPPAPVAGQSLPPAIAEHHAVGAIVEHDRIGHEHLMAPPVQADRHRQPIKCGAEHGEPKLPSSIVTTER